MTKTMTTKEFKIRCKAIWFDKFDYSLVEYVHYKNKVIIICPDHGKFKQTPFGHLQGKEGCKPCLHLTQVGLGLRLPVKEN